MLRSELKVPFAKLWILLSYSDSSARLSRSLNTDALMQWILLAFSSLSSTRDRRRGAEALTLRKLCRDVRVTYSSSREARPSNTPPGSSVILFPYRTLRAEETGY